MFKSLAAWIVTFTLFSATAFAGGSARKVEPPTTVDSVDLQRYQGKWFEIARLPNSFQKDCYNSTAEYAIREDGKVNVTNRCVEVTGKKRESKGTAWSVNAPANSKLKVQFFWPFKGDYWIVALDKDYGWVIVGSPDYKYLWILSREIPIDTGLLQNLLNLASKKGYDTNQLIFDPNISLR